MITYRTATPEDYREYLDEANIVFNLHGTQIDFSTSIPKVYAPERTDFAKIQHIAVDENGRVNALIAVLPNTLTVLGDTLKYGFVGTVSVHPAHRGEGHMKHLMGDVIAEMQQQDADFMMLGGQRQRYQYFGFAKGGRRWNITISRRNILHELKDIDSSAFSFAEILPGTPQEATAAMMHNARPVHYDRSNPGFAIVSRTFYSKPCIIMESGTAIGFLIVNSERDTIEDICLADPAKIKAVLKAWQNETKLEEITLLLPEWEHQLIRSFAVWCEKISVGSSQMVRILHYGKFVETLLKLKASYSRLSDGKVGFLCEGQPFTVTVSNNRVTVTEGAEDPIIAGDALSAGRIFLTSFDWEGRPEEIPADWFPLPVFCPVPDEF